MTKVEKKDKAKKQEEECAKKAAEKDEAYSKRYKAGRFLMKHTSSATMY